MADLSQEWEKAASIPLQSEWDQAKPVALSGVGGGLLQIGTGMVAAPIAGLAGLAGTLLPGESGQGSDIAEKVQSALTYQPRTEEGKRVSEFLTYPFRKLGEAAYTLGASTAERTGSPAGGAAVNTAIQMIPALVSGGAGPKVRSMIEKNAADLAKQQSQASIKNATLDEGRAAGYVVPPDTSILRGLAGKAALRQESIARNQPVTNSLAKKAIEVPDDIALSTGVIRQKIDEFSKPYKELAAIDQEAAMTLEQLKQTRADANGYFKFYEVHPNPAILKKAERLNLKAQSLEKYLDDIATNVGREDLLPAMREARTKIAKAHDVERALNLGTGDVDAHIIGNMYDKGKPLSGELLTIGKFDQAFRRYTTEASKVEAPGGTSLAPYIGAHLGIAGHSSGLGYWPAGVALVGPPARNLLFSSIYQQPKTFLPGTGSKVASVLFDKKTPFTLADIAASMSNEGK